MFIAKQSLNTVISKFDPTHQARTFLQSEGALGAVKQIRPAVTIGIASPSLPGQISSDQRTDLVLDCQWQHGLRCPALVFVSVVVCVHQLNKSTD